MIQVLIADDEPFIRQGLMLLVDWEALGFRICGQASNGTQALEAIPNVRPDLIISDIKMPGMDGLQLAQALHEQYGGDIKMILLSGFYEFDYAKQAIKYQVKDYILKPIVKEELVQVLEAFRTSFRADKEEQQRRRKQEQLVLAQQMQAILLGNADPEIFAGVQRRYPHADRYRCILIEPDAETAQDPRWRSRIEQVRCAFDADSGNELLIDYGTALLHVVADSLPARESLSPETYIPPLRPPANPEREETRFYVGKTVNRLEDLHESYQSCQVVKNLRFFGPSDPVHYFGHTDTALFNDRPGQRERELFDALIFATEQRRSAELREHARAIFRYFLDERIEPGIVRIHLHHLAHDLLRLIDGDPCLADADFMHSAFLQANYARLSIEENIDNLDEFARKCTDKLNEQQKWNAMGVLAKIEAHIREHYTENLSLKLLGEQFYMNSAYLGQIFKKHYGVSFSDYLNQLRIDEAERLLRRTDHKVYEIAEQVGYRDSDYFISRFEKIKGETPAQYRKRTQTEQRPGSSTCIP